MKIVMVLKFFHLVLKDIKKAWKMGFKNMWEPCVISNSTRRYGYQATVAQPKLTQGKLLSLHENMKILLVR